MIHEQGFNYALGDVLRSILPIRQRTGRHVDVVFIERQGIIKGKRPDILIDHPDGPPVVIECSFDDRDADGDARGRLGLEYTKTGTRLHAAIAVAIPPDIRPMRRSEVERALGEGAVLHYALHQVGGSQHRRFPTRGFLTGTVHDLLHLALSEALPKERVEGIGEAVSDRIHQSASVLRSAIPGDRLDGIIKVVQPRSPMRGLKTVSLLWLDALLVQQQLYLRSADGVFGIRFSNPVGPIEQLTIWRAILRRNWRAIYKPAIHALESVTNLDVQATHRALCLLVDAVGQIQMGRLGSRINVGAELFPRISDDRKQAAAFYTQPGTAELLATLTLREDMRSECEWRDSDIFKSMRIADMACGTGTLLRSSYRRVLHLHEKHGGSSSDQIHRDAMEHGLIGLDISPIAAHLTSSSLAAIGSGEPYGETSIGWVAVGGPPVVSKRKKSWRTGSLEYLQKSALTDLFGLAFGKFKGQKVEAMNHHSVKVEHESLDAVLMNPPYTRTKGGQSAFSVAGLTPIERNGCLSSWGSLIEDEPCGKPAGMAASFLCLARKKIKQGGRIGFVLPLSAASAESWRATRKMLVEDFTDILAVTVASGRALGRDALSADTNMEEMLIVATRDDGVRRESTPVTCVTLNQPPTRIGEAREVGRGILELVGRMDRAAADADSLPLLLGDEPSGQSNIFRRTEGGAPWSHVGLMNADLGKHVVRLLDGRIGRENLSVGIVGIQDVFVVGPTHDLIGHPTGGDGRGAFEMQPLNGPSDVIGSDRALWRADWRAQRTLVVHPTHRGVVPDSPATPEDRARMRKLMGRMFYSRNFRMTSQALLVASTSSNVHGGRSWTSLNVEDRRVVKAMALWANSIFGLIVHWSQGQRTHAGRATTQIKAIKRMPCPDFGRLSNSAKDRVASDFDSLKGLSLLPACQAHRDLARMQIDDAVIRLMGLAGKVEDATREMRFLWCHEPSVHGGNQRAVALLETATLDASEWKHEPKAAEEATPYG